MQARDVSGGVHFHGNGPVATPATSPKPRQLPGDVRTFVNRADELSRLDALLSGDIGDSLAVSICVIAGTAGAGKTSLALRWAHQSHAHFPDGQLYVNLRGYDPGAPVTAQEALYRFLLALGVPATAIPADTEASAALYRSLLAGKRMLVVLDNAATVGQVRPLLPGTAGCLVIITSRSRLSGLAVRDGAHRLTVGTLAEPEAVALLRAVTAGYRPQDDADRLVELARLCARLPLALRIAAERAASRPHMNLDDLIRDLRDESALWDALTVGDDEEADAVRTVFTWSYRALPAEAARLFRLLGLHPGPEFGSPAAAALAGVSVSRAQHLLDVLVGAHLLTPTAPDRFEFHDLLRAYAIDQAQHEEPEEEREAALRRVLTWYLHAAGAARTRIKPGQAHIPLSPPGDGVMPPVFADFDEAMRWYEWEHANLLAAARTAAEAGFDRVAWQLPAVLHNVHARLSPFEEWFAMVNIGLRAARRSGDRAGEAELLGSLGTAYTQSHQLAEATECHEGALAVRRERGDREGEARSLNAIGLIKLRARRLDDAETRFTESLALFRELGASGPWEPTLLSNLATVSYEAGRLEDALNLIHQSLAAHRDRGDERGEGNALRILSAVQRERAELDDALESARAALDIALRYRNHSWEGFWLLELGRAQQADGQPEEALVSFQRSAVLHRRLGDRSREARAWHGVGETYCRLGRFEEAASFHRRAAATQRELHDDWQLAAALNGLASALRGAGAEEDARREWREAARLLTAYEDPRAEGLRARIAEALRAVGRGE
ncbi:tetratricopeptide repeat protein [Streptomyces sp. NPDC097640]|uniref:ATP-binding protein n=1 Tax=Streptomyces sp. NPDC097640 TaxID=3157229 RepID=UPI0033176E09